MLDALGNCWTKEFGELELSVHHVLTEPVCPTAIVATENDRGPSWRVDDDTISEAVNGAVAAAYATIIERKSKPLTFPAPPHDEDQRVARFLAAIDARNQQGE